MKTKFTDAAYSSTPGAIPVIGLLVIGRNISGTVAALGALAYVAANSPAAGLTALGAGGAAYLAHRTAGYIADRRMGLR